MLNICKCNSERNNFSTNINRLICTIYIDIAKYSNNYIDIAKYFNWLAVGKQQYQLPLNTSCSSSN